MSMLIGCLSIAHAIAGADRHREAEGAGGSARRAPCRSCRRSGERERVACPHPERQTTRRTCTARSAYVMTGVRRVGFSSLIGIMAGRRNDLGRGCATSARLEPADRAGACPDASAASVVCQTGAISGPDLAHVTCAIERQHATSRRPNVPFYPLRARTQWQTKSLASISAPRTPSSR